MLISHNIPIWVLSVIQLVIGALYIYILYGRTFCLAYIAELRIPLWI